jgi:hypothetical protein
MGKIDEYKDLVSKQGTLEESFEHDASREMDPAIEKVFTEIITESNGREALAELMNDDNPWVRLYAAAASKDLYPERAKAIFTELATRDDLISLKAELNLHTLT